MLSNMKIGTRLIGGFVLVCVLVLATAVWVRGKILELDASDTRLYEMMTVPTAQLVDAIDQLQQIRVLTRDIVRAKSSEVRRTKSDELRKVAEEADEVFTEFEKTLFSEEGKRISREFREAKAAYDKMSSKVIELAEAGQLEEAEAELARGGGLGGKARESLHQLADIKAKYAKKTSDDNTVQANATITATFLVLGLVCLLAMAIGIYITLSITRPMAKMAEAAARIAVGDVEQNLDYRAADETGQLAESFRQAIAYIQDVAKGAEALAGGDLKVQLSPKSEEDRLTRNFMRCVGSIDAMAKDAKALSSAAIEGKLYTRADARRHQGAYAEIVSGVNRTLDTLVGFIDAIPSPVMIINRDFAIQYMNGVGAKVGGRTPAELVGVKCYEHFKTTDCRTERCACHRAMSANTNARSETLARPGNLELEIAYDAVPVRDANGQAVGALEIVTDQTEIKKSSRRSLKINAYQTGEAKRVTEYLNQLAAGDLTVEAKASDGDADVAEAKATFEQIASAVTATATSLRKAMTQVSSAVEQISSASTQIAATSQSVAQGASEQAASLEQTSSSLEEMSGMTRQNAENTQSASKLAMGAKLAADKGSTAMSRMTEAMAQIRTASQSTAEIIKDINEIAFQTNLLALNAAVEAARAGDAGRGFAVVAEEVRSLASRAKDAAKKTEDLIKQSVDLSNNGTAITKEVEADLGEIVSVAAKVTNIVTEIAAASSEQAKGIGQINNAVAQMDKVTQQAASSAEEASSASEELLGQSQELSAMVAQFKIGQRVKAASAAALPKPAPRTAKAALPPKPRPQAPKASATTTLHVKPEDVIPLDSDEDFKEF